MKRIIRTPSSYWAEIALVTLVNDLWQEQDWGSVSILDLSEAFNLCIILDWLWYVGLWYVGLCSAVLYWLLSPKTAPIGVDRE